MTEEESYNSVSDEQCRYCLGPVTKDVDYKPCNCTSLVHRECLNTWVNQNQNMLQCEICHTQLNIITTRQLKNCGSFAYKYELFFLFCFLAVPFIGIYPSNDLYIDNVEYLCMDGYTHQQFIYSFSIFCNLGIFLSVIFLACFIAICILFRINNSLDVKDYGRHLCCMLFTLHVLIYTIALGLTSTLEPIKWDSQQCSVYNQVEIDRINWIFPSFGIGVWFIGFNFFFIIFLCLLFIYFVFYGIVLIIKHGISCCFVRVATVESMPVPLSA